MGRLSCLITFKRTEKIQFCLLLRFSGRYLDPSIKSADGQRGAEARGVPSRSDERGSLVCLVTE